MIKRLLITSLVFSLAFFVSASGSDCSQGGYDYCYQGTNGDNFAKIFYSIKDDNGKINFNSDGYAVGELYLDYGYQGDEIYFIENLPGWSTIIADEYELSRSDNGLITAISTSNNQWRLAKRGEEYNECPILCAYDTDYDYYVDACYGWLGSSCSTLKVVECASDSDCSSNEVCDKSGSWEDWECKAKECDEGEEKCEGAIWFTCSPDNTWGQQGVIEGKCNAECIIGSDCGQPSSEEYCSGNNLMQKKTDYDCSNNFCVNLIDDIVLEQCEFSCGVLPNDCQGDFCTQTTTYGCLNQNGGEDNYLVYILFTIVGLVIIGLGYLYYKTRK